MYSLPVYVEWFNHEYNMVRAYIGMSVTDFLLLWNDGMIIWRAFLKNNAGFVPPFLRLFTLYLIF